LEEDSFWDEFLRFFGVGKDAKKDKSKSEKTASDKPNQQVEDQGDYGTASGVAIGAGAAGTLIGEGIAAGAISAGTAGAGVLIGAGGYYIYETWDDPSTFGGQMVQHYMYRNPQYAGPYFNAIAQNIMMSEDAQGGSESTGGASDGAGGGTGGGNAPNGGGGHKGLIPWATGMGVTGQEAIRRGLISRGDFLRIQNAATRIKKAITLVGSRASGKAGANSDWDYVIQGGLKNSKEWSKLKNSLPGARSILDRTSRNIDILPGPVKPNKPHITIFPR
jgi:hypothetical protein